MRFANIFSFVLLIQKGHYVQQQQSYKNVDEGPERSASWLTVCMGTIVCEKSL